jgi:hypothetical protein
MECNPVTSVIVRGEILSKINPGSNRHGDNDTQTAHAGGMQDIEFPEPKELTHGKYQCTLCNEIFNSREDYISHALAKINQPGHITQKAKPFHKKTRIEQE